MDTKKLSLKSSAHQVLFTSIIRKQTLVFYSSSDNKAQRELQTSKVHCKELFILALAESFLIRKVINEKIPTFRYFT